MTTAAQLSYSPLPNYHRFAGKPHFAGDSSCFPSISLPLHPTTSSANLSISLLQPRASNTSAAAKLELSGDGGNDGGGIGRGTGGGGSGEGWSSGGSKDEDSGGDPGFGVLGLLLNGWRSRVAADPQFPFKVLMEELVGVSACVLGDMASRPNFGLNELDFVFSTLVVGSILNFVLMYLLAPTMSSSSSNLPAIFANCPTSHMFEPGAYSVLDRLGTFVYKGTVFAAVGFAAGLVGTALSNGLIKMRKKMDPSFETPNKAPPTLLNASTWALHMGLSSNLRYQTLNGLEFLLAKGLPPLAFKSSVVVLRCLNNVLGGVSFVMLARLTGSQKAESGKTAVALPETVSAEEKVKLLEGDENLQTDDWATRGGLEKIDWSKAPFYAYYKDFDIEGCSVPGSATCASNPRNWWEAPVYQLLDSTQARRYRWVRMNHMIYDYCADRSRYPVVPPEFVAGI